MLIKDYLYANATGIAEMYWELVAGKRQIALFLLDVHPKCASHVTSHKVIGIGWDDNPPEGHAPTLRWLGEGLSPSGVGSSFIHSDRDVALIILSNMLAREALTLEKEVGTNIWQFAQPHIKTVADSAKLSRYLAKYQPTRLCA